MRWRRRSPPSETISHRERFDLVIGSGRKGQTYLYWKGSDLFELPGILLGRNWSADEQSGYPDGLPNFDKPISSPLPGMSCHLHPVAPSTVESVRQDECGSWNHV